MIKRLNAGIMTELKYYFCCCEHRLAILCLCGGLCFEMAAASVIKCGLL